MFAQCVTTYTTLRWVILTTASLQALHSRSFLRIGHALSATWARMYSKRSNPHCPTTTVVTIKVATVYVLIWTFKSNYWHKRRESTSASCRCYLDVITLN